MNAKTTEDSTHTIHVDVTMQDWLAKPKPKTTWTRLRQKDHGPGEKESEEHHSVLGKWVLTETVGNNYNKVMEAQIRRKSKPELQDKCKDEISVRVVDHPCRKQ